MSHCEPLFPRRRTRTVRVASVLIGSDHPVSVQSMITVPAENVEAAVAQIVRLAEAGAQLVRLAVPTPAAAKALRAVCDRSPVPLVADIHFNARLALAAMEAGAAKIRINPGNIPVADDLYRVIDEAGRRGTAIRIGVNSGSVMPRDRHDARQHTPQEIARRMVEAARSYLDLFERRSFRDIVLSLKGSDVPTTVWAYRRMAEACDYPLHLGITAAGPREEAVLKSAAGLGALLAEGIGDTLRISITGDPVNEVHVGRRLLEVMGLAPLAGVEIISCPTCGRCEVDLTSLAEKLYEATRSIRKPLRVAVMGCVVNGPGEAREADLGVAAGRGFGVFFRHGQTTGEKIPQDHLFERTLDEIRRLTAS